MIDQKNVKREKQKKTQNNKTRMTSSKQNARRGRIVRKSPFMKGRKVTEGKEERQKERGRRRGPFGETKKGRENSKTGR